MKTIITTAGSGFFARNFLRTDAIGVIGASDVRLVVLAPKQKLEYYRREFRQPFLVWDELPDVSGSLVEKFFHFIEMSAIHTRTVTFMHATEFRRKGSQDIFLVRLLRFLLRRSLWFLGQFKTFRRFLRFSYRLFPSNIFAEAFRKYSPDLVFCPTMVYHDQLILKEAKRRRLKTAGMVLSWDNIYTKSFLRVSPDHLFVQTETIADQAKRLADYPREKMTVVGVPQYDSYFKNQGLSSREDFCRQIGADPGKKIILYAFSGKAGFQIDLEMLGILARAIKRGVLMEEVSVLVRPYPKRDMSAATLESLGKRYGFLGLPAAAHVGGGRTDWEFDEAALKFLKNSIAHSALVITMFSTFLIEASIFDKPVLVSAFEGDLRLDYWNSAKRFFEWDHLRDIKKHGGLSFAESEAEFISIINECLQDPSRLRLGRKAIVEEQANFTDGECGRRLGEGLLNLLK